jgi:hypothetical protein
MRFASNAGHDFPGYPRLNFLASFRAKASPSRLAASLIFL